MGMISERPLYVARPDRGEDFESRFVNSLQKIHPFVSKSPTVEGGCTQVTVISELGTGAKSWIERSFSPEPRSLLRRVSCRAASNCSFLRVFSALWPRALHHLQSQSRLWFRLWKKCPWANIANHLAGRTGSALPMPLRSLIGGVA